MASMDTSRTLPPPEATPVLLFGCQCLSFSKDDFLKLRTIVWGSPEYRWVLDVFAELPVYHRTATKYLPKLQTISGEQQLRDLNQWLHTGQVPGDAFPLPYIQLAPLLMITHFSQYLQYLQLVNPSGLEGRLLPGVVLQVENVGFCIGFLSAMVVSISSTLPEFEQHASVAVRLAMLMGAIGDAQEREEPYTSMATVWKQTDQEQKLNETLARFPEAYITVRYDENRATVMTPRRTMVQLEKALDEAGLTTNQVDFNGRYHWEGHRETLVPLLKMCADDPALRFVQPGSEAQANSSLHATILESILAKQCQWQQTFSAVYNRCLVDKDTLVVEFGPEKCVPPTFMRCLRGRVIHFADLEPEIQSRISYLRPQPRTYDEDIAIVGVACRVAGAEDLEEFWQLLCSGESQHRELPPERYEHFETPWRPEALRPWLGNFVRDIDAFDHKFFKKVPREAMSQDPQQRLILQVAYQALEQAGYFQCNNQDRNIGCYIASCTVDYEHNVNCHTASAYAATGLLRSFLAGKLSHYFGWRGPAFCIDSACSGSAVALHQACQALLNGECTAALVGGANAIMSPLAYDNLAGASFVSPTGPCKPFDAKADGYCRGEGFAAIYIKKMSDALAAGDTILATIAATAVEQNNNCTPIVVPDSASLAGLFTKVTRRARISPRDISVVEAHGTGTQAGDPAEYESVRKTLGGPQRRSPLFLGSVKGLVGHTEGVSGLIALVKVLLMLQEGQVPPQPNFQQLNPHIITSPDDRIEIATKLRPWEATHRAVLINNYGASGSNASMVITQAPSGRTGSLINQHGVPLPFHICGLDFNRIRAYAERLRQFLQRKIVSARHLDAVANLSFNMCRQSNPTLDTQIAFTCSSCEELEQKLTSVSNGDESGLIKLEKQPRPVILCFGGQISTSIGLDRGTYDALPLIRKHLDECDSLLVGMGYEGLYPGIFSDEPIPDQMKLQTKLFALQYACARSWIDSGLSVAAVVGHSFGEITASCVSGTMSLSDALCLVARRAEVIRNHWGTDAGGMIAIDGDLVEVEMVLRCARDRLGHKSFSTEVACYNGPRSFTVAGSTASIDAVDQVLKSEKKFSNLRSKRLSVTNAFHSPLVESILPELEKVTEGLEFQAPSIHLERATKTEATGSIPNSFAADHLRQPVYFHHAVERLAEKYGRAVWLEAGSNSTITAMAARAVGASTGHHFQAVNVTSGSGLQSLTESTVNLWKQGVHVRFWGHHACQSAEYAPIVLPPYQFEKSRHWMENKKLPSPAPGTQHMPNGTQNEMIMFSGYEGKNQEVAKFRINTLHPTYQSAVSGHVVAHAAPVAPASIILDTVLEALFIIPEGKGMIPQVYNVTSDAPLCLNLDRELWIELKTNDSKRRIWDLKYLTKDPAKGDKSALIHCQARIVLNHPDDKSFQREWDQYSRLVSHRRCKDLLNNSDDVDDILQGRNIYPTFSEIVDYSERYRGVRKLVGKGCESAGRVVKQYTGDSWADPYLCDCFSQVGGFWVNCMTDRPSSDIYLANGMERWMRTPKYADIATPRPDTWEVFAMHQRHEGYYMSDIFVFDSTTGNLVEIFLGMQYASVAKSTFRMILSKFAPGYKPDAGPAAVPEHKPSSSAYKQVTLPSIPETKSSAPKKGGSDLVGRVKAVVAEFCAMDPGDISDDGNLADAGIDSLMAMELAKELEQKLSCTLSPTDIMEADTFRDLVKAVQAALGEEGDIEEPAEEVETASDACGSDHVIVTPPSNSDTSVLSDVHELELPDDIVLESFGETKALTDKFLAENHCSGRVHAFAPVQTQLCIALTLEAFDELGSCIRTARPGQVVEPISFDPQHQELVNYLYTRLEEARLVDLDGTTAIRTAIAIPPKSSKTILEDIARVYPEYAGASRLAFFTGSRLASVLRGDQDGLQLIFGTKEGQELVSWMYGDEPHNVVGYKQMIDFIQRLSRRIQKSDTTGPLRILEMGAGTGGGTKWFLPELAKLGIPVEFTFTDISPAFLAQARRRFRDYPFLQYRVHDIEKPPADDLVGTQHIIIASNAVHATSNLQESTRNMRRALRPDGVVLMLEMTRPQFAVDIVFGLFRGWWVFNDGRNHAITGEKRWEDDLHAVDYGHVDWTDGHSPEVSVQRVIFAMASGMQRDRLPLGMPLGSGDLSSRTDSATRQRVVDEYIRRAAEGFRAPGASAAGVQKSVCVLVTGGTGSLGSHIVAHLARLPHVKRVTCLNRCTKTGNHYQRQRLAFEKRGIELEREEINKVVVYESNTTETRLGLTPTDYNMLVSAVTHIVHNAWPMNGAGALSGFEGQFDVMHHLVNLARDIACQRPASSKVHFQFISSIGVVGHQPLLTGKEEVLEERAQIDGTLSNGYSEAKYICERILDETLHRYPDRFSAMVVRPGQIAGSSQTGYWNSSEHVPALIKSSQTLRALPDFHGVLSWTPVDYVAGTAVELLLSGQDAYPVYHIDNPVRQDWAQTIQTLAKELDIPSRKIIPFKEWIQRVKAFPGTLEDNPATVMADWLGENFERMSCGGLLLSTAKAREHSPTLAKVGPVGEAVIRKYLQEWRRVGFLH